MWDFDLEMQYELIHQDFSQLDISINFHLAFLTAVTHISNSSTL